MTDAMRNDMKIRCHTGTSTCGACDGALARMAVLFVVVLFAALRQSTGTTVSFFTDETDISGITFTAGSWLPTLAMSVAPVSPDGKGGSYRTTPCVTLSYAGLSSGNATIYYEFSNDGDPKDGGSVYPGVCVPVPDGNPTFFQAVAVNDENDAWRSAVLSASYMVDTGEGDDTGPSISGVTALVATPGYDNELSDKEKDAYRKKTMSLCFDDVGTLRKENDDVICDVGFLVYLDMLADESETTIARAYLLPQPAQENIEPVKMDPVPDAEPIIDIPVVTGPTTIETTTIDIGSGI